MNTSAAENESSTRPKVGVVVSSGGIKSISSIALFEFLEKSGIEVDLLVACSGGSLFSGWWAVCKDTSYMRENIKSVWSRECFAKKDYRTLLSIAGLPFGRFDKTRGLLKPHMFKDILRQHLGDLKMEDLDIRMILQATDLLSGDPVLLKTGLLRETIYASAALFPIFPPICIDNRWLMDGVYSAPLPILQAVMEGMDIIIAMTNEEMTQKESKGFVQYFMRCIQYTTNWLQRNQSALSIDMHHHEIIFINAVFDRFIGLRSAHLIPDIIKAGESAVEEKKAELLKALENFSVTDRDNPVRS